MTSTTLMLTRPRSSAQAFVDSLSQQAVAAVDIVIAPLMEIVVTNAVLDLTGVRSVIFTSANGVHHGPEGQGRIAFCVGAQTTDAAQKRGWIATQAGDTAGELIATLIAQQPKGPALHLGGEHTRGDIAQKLTQCGIETRHVAIYAQKLVSLDADGQQALNGPCIIPVFSPRTGQQLAQQARGRLQNAHIVALSDAVAAPLLGQKVAQMQILPAPRSGYMRKAVEILCLDLTLP
ncbi:uroporphyrinogen-III synthase [uncultured Sulfitobacter sp.]|uniref:uroporphyrinogen-III synthase n=1 Tax=uncultured Sulfitobacter sp. TaxID=191468 RepID=UPI002606B5CE|nr:uroporphyrinogen-III synthase [uncultured Sulfitobacter sp.]